MHHRIQNYRKEDLDSTSSDTVTPLSNSDFRKLLMTPRSTLLDHSKQKTQTKYVPKRKDAHHPDSESNSQDPSSSLYRDRAKERREAENLERASAPTNFDPLAKPQTSSADDSAEVASSSTGLISGLDYSQLRKSRDKISLPSSASSTQDLVREKLLEQVDSAIHSRMAKNICSFLLDKSEKEKFVKLDAKYIFSFEEKNHWQSPSVILSSHKKSSLALQTTDEIVLGKLVDIFRATRSGRREKKKDIKTISPKSKPCPQPFASTDDVDIYDDDPGHYICPSPKISHHEPSSPAFNDFSNLDNTIDGPYPADSVVGPYPEDSVVGPYPDDSVVGPYPEDSVVGPYPADSVVGPYPEDSVVGPYPDDSVVGPYPEDSVVGPYPDDSISSNKNIKYEQNTKKKKADLAENPVRKRQHRVFSGYQFSNEFEYVENNDQEEQDESSEYFCDEMNSDEEDVSPGNRADPQDKDPQNSKKSSAAKSLSKSSKKDKKLKNDLTKINQIMLQKNSKLPKKS